MSNQDEKKVESDKSEDEDWQVKVAEAETKAKEYLSGWQRAQADYQNLQKELISKTSQVAEYALGQVLLELLPIHDHFKLALKQASPEEKNGWQVGVEQIKKELDVLLNKFGVKEISTVGETLDPAKHEAIGKEKRTGVEVDKIIEEISTGYEFNGKTLIPAKVVVAE